MLLIDTSNEPKGQPFVGDNKPHIMFDDLILSSESGQPLHSGVDFFVDKGTGLVATAHGDVIEVGKNESLGRYVIIRHKGGFETVYGYLDEIYVYEGMYVARRDVIGTSGDSEHSGFPSLHYEIHLNGTPVDPLDYLK